MGAFEDFVNTELPLRTNVSTVPTASRYPRFTGVGRAVEERTPAEVRSDIDAAATDHDADHVTGGSDKIRDATAAQDGLATAAQVTKLDGIEDAANDYSHPDHSGDVTSNGDGETTVVNIPEKWRSRPFNITIPLPVADEEHVVTTFKYAATMQEVRDICKAAVSVTYSFYTRSRATPWTAAGQVTIVDEAVATTTENAATIASAALAAGTQLICKLIAVSGTPEEVIISGDYTKD